MRGSSRIKGRGALLLAALLGCNGGGAAPGEPAAADVEPVPATPEPAPEPMPPEPGPAPGQPITGQLPLPPPSGPQLPMFASARLEHDGALLDLAWSADGSRIVSAAADGKLRIWDAGSHALLHTLDGWPAPPGHVAITRDGATVVGHAALEVRVFDAATGTLRHTLAHETPTCAVAITPDGATIVSAGQDGVRTWSAEGQPQRRLEQRGKNILSLVMLDEHEALSGWSDGKVRRIDVERGRFVGKALAIDGELGRLAHDNGRFAIAGHDGKLQAWDASTGKLLARAELPTPLAVGVDGNLMLATSPPGADGHLISIVDVASGMIARDFIGHEGPIVAAAFSPDGNEFASGDERGVVLIWAAP